MSSNMPQHDPAPGAEHAPASGEGAYAGVGYEQRDANIKVILWLTFGVTVTCFLVFWGSLALRDHFEAIAKSNDPELSPLADLDQEPPAPLLQHNSFQELVEFRAAEEHMLNSYGWIDRAKGQVQIPVSRAMDLILERGLPAPKGEPQPGAAEHASPENAPSNEPNVPPPAAEETAPDQQPTDRPTPEN